MSPDDYLDYINILNCIIDIVTKEKNGYLSINVITTNKVVMVFI